MARAPFIAVGKPVGQVEGPAKVSGQAVYAADVLLPGMLWGKVLRSPFAHARIVHIDTSRAQALSGVRAVVTAADLPEILTGRRMRDLPVLARDKVRFVGERVAAVAADSPDIAEEALTLIDVEYAELPAVFDPLSAMEPGAPRVHDRPSGYAGAPQPPPPDLPNLFSLATWKKSDIAQGFAESDLVFEHTFTTPPVHQAYIEPHACTVALAPDDRVEVWISNKTPFAVREQLAHAVEMPQERIRVHLTHIGGDFGGKGSLMDAPIAYHLARRTGRPIKMVMTYLEELTAGNPRHASVITVKTGVKRDGTMVARQARVMFNSGAYAAFKPSAFVNLGGAHKMGGPHKVPHTLIEAYCVYTNTIPCSHMRAPGDPQAIFALESHLDLVAQELGMDPLEFRLKNLVEEGDESALGERWHNVKGRETLLAAVRASGWGELKPSPTYGRGIALFERAPGGGQATIVLEAEAHGGVTMITAAPDTGTGNHTILRQIVAEVLQVPLETIRVEQADTDAVPYDAGVGGSRVTHVHGQAAYQAAQKLLARVTQPAGSDGLPFPEAVQRAVRLAGGPLRAEGSYEGRPLEITAFCAQVAEVEVDRETGQVQVRRIVSAHDAGTVINPMSFQGQVEGGVIQGLGYALMEELQIADGRVTTVHLGDYKIPNIRDIPELVTVLVESADGPSPFHGKAIGEHAICPVAGAIANAVADAVGVRITDLPITAEKVFLALRAKESGRSV